MRVHPWTRVTEREVVFRLAVDLQRTRARLVWTPLYENTLLRLYSRSSTGLKSASNDLKSHNPDREDNLEAHSRVCCGSRCLIETRSQFFEVDGLLGEAAASVSRRVIGGNRGLLSPSVHPQSIGRSRESDRK